MRDEHGKEIDPLEPVTFAELIGTVAHDLVMIKEALIDLDEEDEEIKQSWEEGEDDE